MNSEDSYQTINYRISEWAGIDGTEYFGRYGRSFEKDWHPHDYYRTNAAMDLLGVLVDKGISTNIDVNKNGTLVQLRCSESGAKSWAVHEFTIPAAICNAICELIDREGR